MVREQAINLDDFHRAVDICHRHDLGVIANVSLGAALLAELSLMTRNVLSDTR